MSRLTRRAENGTAVYATPSGEPVKWENNRRKVLQKLADYEDLEEQGLLLKLPCRVGDIIYEVDESILLDNVIEPIECRVNYIIFKSSIHMGVEVIKGHGVGSSYNFEL